MNATPEHKTPTNYVRKLRVNDTIHSFCWQCRHIMSTPPHLMIAPYLLLGWEKYSNRRYNGDKQVSYRPAGHHLHPFVQYLLAHIKTLDYAYVSAAFRPMWQLEADTEDWSQSEWDYAIYLLRKYYTL